MDVVLAVSSVAYSSADYWENNSESWLRENGGEEILLMKGPSVRTGRSFGSIAVVLAPFGDNLYRGRWSHLRVIKADVRGAIVGAIGGFIVGGQVVQGALVGSIVSSADEALEQLFELLS